MSDPSLDDYDFPLPEELIAQEPCAERTGSRLLVLDRSSGRREHRHFHEIESFLRPGDLLVLNRSKVVPARLYGRRVRTGGKAELLLVAPRGDGLWDGLLRTRGKPESGERLAIDGSELAVELVERGPRGRWTLRLGATTADPLDLLQEAGVMPLPPYIKRSGRDDPRAALDRERYQTVYAREAGAVAAPTAGLHFDQALLDRLEQAGVGRAEVVLHVGLGTFQPIEIDDFRGHEMHEERFHLPEATARAVTETRARGGRVVAVGTTSVRTLESCWDEERGELIARAGTTRIFIHPPKTLKSVDALITNFHLPRSTLMLLVSAFAGREAILAAYDEAIARRYRFFSYGDAMLIL